MKDIQNVNKGYFYDRQIKRYVGMFMAMFTGMEVRTGKHNDTEYTSIDVPILYGSKDRVVAAALAENTQNKPIRLPAMSVNMVDLRLAPHRMKGTGIVRNTPHLPLGGVFPDDITSISQRMPVPYDLTVSLNLITSNFDQHVQLLEQILVLFDPSFQIERSDSLFDWAKVVQVTLEQIRLDENFPAGIDSRRMESSITFNMGIWLEIPAIEYNNIIRSVHMRVQAVGDLAEFVDSVAIASEEDYDVIASANQLV